MKLIVGLGNPGPEYEATRHNVGFMVVRELAARHRVKWTVDARKQFASAGWKEPQGDYVTLFAPQTYMNHSGNSLVDGRAAHGWNPALEEHLIVCDDVQLPFGQRRLRASGSDGGHRGLASCLACLGSQDVPRLRIGVGREPLPNDLTDFVLSPFDRAEQPLLAQVLSRAAEACELWVQEGIEVAMNRVNTSVEP